MDRYYNLDVLADVLAKSVIYVRCKASHWSKPMSVRHEWYIKSVVCMGDTRSDSSSKEFIL